MSLRLIGLMGMLIIAMGAGPAVREPGEQLAGPDAGANPPKMDNTFAVNLYQRLADGNEKNLLFSPVSIHTALAMAWAGARGQTAEQMARTLHFPNHSPGPYLLKFFLQSVNGVSGARPDGLSIANALWGQKGYPFMPEYLKTVDTDYGGHLAELDFVNASEAARQTINDWASAQTHERIQELLPPKSITPETRLVLTNAIYFKGKWELPFLKSGTADLPFTTGDGKQVTVPMMIERENLRYAEDNAVQLVERPYASGELALRLFVPKAADGLWKVEKDLTDKQLRDLSAHATTTDTCVWLPRFKLETRYDQELKKDLVAMGMGLAFGPEADFSGISSAENLSISEIIHKAFMQVDEEGTEAAAATAVGLFGSAQPPPKVFLRADHPFLFSIVDRATGAMLFLGRVENPQL
jgi:serpin B